VCSLTKSHSLIAQGFPRVGVLFIILFQHEHINLVYIVDISDKDNFFCPTWMNLKILLNLYFEQITYDTTIKHNAVQNNLSGSVYVKTAVQSCKRSCVPPPHSAALTHQIKLKLLLVNFWSSWICIDMRGMHNSTFSSHNSKSQPCRGRMTQHYSARLQQITPHLFETSEILWLKFRSCLKQTSNNTDS